MTKRERAARLAAVTMLGLAAAILQTGYNYQWRNGRWSPHLPWLIPIVAALPPIALYLGLRELFRKDDRLPWPLVAAMLVLALFSILVAIAPLYFEAQLATS